MPERASPTLLFGRVTAIFGQHAGLLNTSKRLRRVSASLRDGAAEEGGEIQSLVEEFGKQLASHFAAEENESYFGTLVSDCPEFNAPIAKLIAEHREMTERFKRLSEFVSTSHTPAALQTKLEELLNQFENHERHENLLLQEFFLRDEGGGGQ